MTVEEFLKSKGIDTNNYVIHDITGTYLPTIPIHKWLIEFTQYHVKKALEAASTEVRITYNLLENSVEEEEVPVYIGEMESAYINRDSILNAYPLDQIK